MPAPSAAAPHGRNVAAYIRLKRKNHTHGTDPVVGDKIRYIVAGFASLPEAQALREKDQMYEGIDAIKMSSAVTGIFGKNDLPEEFSQTIPFEYIEKH